MITRLFKQPQISFMGCINAYKLFADLPFIHPPENGFDERWYTMDIFPDTDVLFLCNALDVSGFCASCGFSPEFDKQTKMETDKLVTMLADKQYISSQSYQDRQSSLKLDDTDSKILPQILQIRKMMHSEESSCFSYGVRFKEVAKIVEDLEDDRPLSPYCISPVTYESNMADLRAYFSWRTRYRKGEDTKVPDAFAALYAAETVNGIGWTDPADGEKLLLRALKNLATQRYRCRYLRWFYDFMAYFNLPHNWEFSHTEAEEAVLKLMHPEEITSENVIPFLKFLLSSVSTYDLETKKAYVEHPDDYKEVFVRFFRILVQNYGSEDQSSKLVFEWNNDSWYELFCNLPFQLDCVHGNYTYKLDDLSRYKFEGDYCIFSTCRLSRKFTTSMRDILPTVESLLRKEFGLSKTKEKLPPESEYYQCIVKAIHDWKVKKNKRVVVIDSSKLESVRQDAQETSQKIMTSEEIDNVPDVQNDVKEEKIVEVVSAETDEVDSSDESSVLDADEAAFLILLIDGLDWQKFLKTTRMMPSLIVDSVNDKLFEEFGDTVLEMRDGKPVVIEDYLEDLKRMLGL